MPRSTGPTDISGLWLNITSFICKPDFCYDVIPLIQDLMFEEFSNRAAVISIVGNFKTSNDDAK